MFELSVISDQLNQGRMVGELIELEQELFSGITSLIRLE